MKKITFIIMNLLLFAAIFLMVACSTPAATPQAEALHAPSLTWTVADFATGETSAASNLVALQAEQIVTVTLTVEDPAGVIGIGLNRNGFFKCQMGEEVQFNRSVTLGSSAEGTPDEPEPAKSLDIVIDPTKWRCPEGWELAGGFVDLEGSGTNVDEQTGLSAIYVVK